MNSVGLYVHIPFCYSKCYYCSFNSYPIRDFQKDFLEKYFKKVILQLEFYSKFNFSLKSIYIGGGTPSIVNPIFIENIFNEIFKRYKVVNNCEITIEVNPKTFSIDKLKTYKSFGINRISVGIQSFIDKFLKILGRPYSSYEAVKSLEIVSNYFENINIDLIFGIPFQSLKDIEKEFLFLKRFPVKHVSYYCLSIEEDTEFFKKGYKEISDDIFSKMYDLIIEKLNELRFSQYEISNFSKKNYFCRHNLNYWNYGEYIGVGAGAVSFFNRIRTKNFSNPKIYVKKEPNEYEERECINLSKQKFEYIMLNLRKVEGINLHDYKKRFNNDFFKEFNEVLKKFKDFFEIKKDNVNLNIEGFKVSNLILSEFLK